jgi:hypothetical protein
MKVQGSLEMPQLSSPSLKTFSLYGEGAGLLRDAPTVCSPSRFLVKVCPNFYLFSLLTFSLYGESAGLYLDAPTVLPLVNTLLPVW